MSHVFRLLIALGLWLLQALPAYASFGDCNDPSYLARFDSRLGSESGFLCTESARVPVRTAEGVRHIRMVEHLVSDWARAPGAMRAFKNGIDGSVQAMAKLGNFSMPDVTILLMDGFEAPAGVIKKEDFGHIAAITDFVKDDGECHITFYLLGLGATAEYGASVMAHELFHCIESATLSQAQFDTGNFGNAGGGTWWIEGAADWFSTLAVPAPDFLRERVAVFDKNSQTFALNEMAYEAWVFFAWLGGKKTPRAVLPFLRQMAATTGSAAQRRAMMAALPQDQWHEFAQDYFDRTITDGQGASIGSTPAFKKTIEWSASRTENIPLTPFVLKRAKLKFNCGLWGVGVAPRDRYIARMDYGSGARPWLGMPDTIDARDGEAKQYLFAAMLASTTGVTSTVNGNVQEACGSCASVTGVDQCLVGNWEMTVDGVMRWVQQRVPSAARVTGPGLAGSRLIFAEEGTYRLLQAPARVGLEMPDEQYRGVGRLLGPINGNWSAANGSLNMCPRTRGVTGTATTSSGGISQTSPMPLGGLLQQSTRTYTCSGDRMTMTSPMGGGGAATWEFRRTSGP